MTALAADRNVPRALDDVFSFPVEESTKIYKGAMVCINAAGYAIPAANTAGLVFVGVAEAQADNSSGSDGDISVRVRMRGLFEFVAAGLTQAAVNADMYVSDDQTVTTTEGNGVRVGRLLGINGATVAKVAIDAIGDYTKGQKYFIVQAALGGTIGATPKTLLSFEQPAAFSVLRGYAEVVTAPAALEPITVTITDGVTPKTVTIAAEATHGEDEAIDQAYAADTDMTITAVDTGTTGADLNVLFVCQYT